jgi:hypothetical protein
LRDGVRRSQLVTRLILDIRKAQHPARIGKHPAPVKHRAVPVPFMAFDGPAHLRVEPVCGDLGNAFGF